MDRREDNLEEQAQLRRHPKSSTPPSLRSGSDKGKHWHPGTLEVTSIITAAISSSRLCDYLSHVSTNPDISPLPLPPVGPVKEAKK